jgi:hypothetical protein
MELKAEGGVWSENVGVVVRAWTSQQLKQVTPRVYIVPVTKSLPSIGFPLAAPSGYQTPIAA